MHKLIPILHNNTEFYEIPNFAKYFISKAGEVYSIKSNKILKNSGNPYLMVSLIMEGVITRLYLHRLVATVFIPNPDNKPTVNHRDGNKLNNCLDNLEWMTIKENVNHAVETGLLKFKKGIENPQYGKKMDPAIKKVMSEKKKGSKHPKFKGLIVTPFGKFESSYDAAKAEGCSHMTIQRKCKNEEIDNYFIF